MAKLTENPERKAPAGQSQSHPTADHVQRRQYIAARPLSGFIPKLTKKAFEKHGFSSAALIADWQTIVGRDLARIATPERLKWPRAVDYSDDGNSETGAGRPGATLIVGVDAANALEIEYTRGQILDRVNAYFGYAAVAALKVAQRPGAAAGLIKSPNQDRCNTTPGLRPETAQTPPELSADIEDVEGDELRSALARLAANIAGEAGKSGRN